jgi:hypothetical protein
MGLSGALYFPMRLSVGGRPPQSLIQAFSSSGGFYPEEGPEKVHASLLE